MDTESALGAHRTSAGRGPSGLRRLSLAMLATEHTAERFAGLSGAGEGATRPGHLLAAFKAAAPYLGLAPRVVHAIDWLFAFTQPQDWAEGSRPVVWPSAATQREALGLGLTQVKSLNRHLVELGLVVMRDSPNGKRYGRRSPQGRIIEAYGFDLSPIAARYEEFQALATAGRVERERMRRLRRRSTIARNGFLQILETVAELGLSDASWTRLEAEARHLARSLQKVERVEEMEFGVVSLERRQLEARERLESLIAAASPQPEASSEGVDSDPKGSEYRPHILTTNQTLNLKDTVIASEESKSRTAGSVSHPDTTVPRHGQERGRTEKPARTDELVRLAPRLRPYLASGSPTWPEIVEAADWLRHDIGVSKPLWGEACLTMGREEAAIAVAIVSAKTAVRSPGGYFFGMVAKAKAGELNLARTVWGLRSRGHQKICSKLHANTERSM
jgi:replication initiation protein RepC